MEKQLKPIKDYQYEKARLNFGEKFMTGIYQIHYTDVKAGIHPAGTKKGAPGVVSRIEKCLKSGDTFYVSFSTDYLTHVFIQNCFNKAKFRKALLTELKLVGIDIEKTPVKKIHLKV